MVAVRCSGTFHVLASHGVSGYLRDDPVSGYLVLLMGTSLGFNKIFANIYKYLEKINHNPQYCVVRKWVCLCPKLQTPNSCRWSIGTTIKAVHVQTHMIHFWPYFSVFSTLNR